MHGMLLTFGSAHGHPTQYCVHAPHSTPSCTGTTMQLGKAFSFARCKAARVRLPKRPSRQELGTASTGVCYVIASGWGRAIWRAAPALIRPAYLYVLDGLVTWHAPPNRDADVHVKWEQDALCWQEDSSFYWIAGTWGPIYQRLA